jgi:hypothetical protein
MKAQTRLLAEGRAMRAKLLWAFVMGKSIVLNFSQSRKQEG